MSFASPDCLSTLNESTTTVEDYRTQVTYYDTTLLDQLVGLSDKHLDLDDWGFSGDLKVSDLINKNGDLILFRSIGLPYMKGKKGNFSSRELGYSNSLNPNVSLNWNMYTVLVSIQNVYTDGEINKLDQSSDS